MTRRVAGHDRRPVQRALFAAGDPGPDEVQAPLTHRFLAAHGVGVQRIAAVDDDVAGFHGVSKFVDDSVSGLSGLDHDQHPTRFFQCGKKFGDRFTAHELAV